MTVPTTAQRHPVRAFLWGILIGLSVAIYLTLVFPLVKLATLQGLIVQLVAITLVVAVVVTLLTVFVLPPRQPKGPPPTPTAKSTGSDDAQ